MASKIVNSGFKNWTPDQLPDLSGKRYLITGANSGIGLEAAKHLRGANADVLVGSRSPAKAYDAVAVIEAVPGTGSVSSVIIDLADTSSIRAASEQLHSDYDGLDAVINNAGVMQPPQGTTADGFELQFGTNHLGHFLLNGLLLDLLEVRSGRIVAVSSVVHRRAGGIDFDDPMLTRTYSPTKAYMQSKLANLMYGLELQRRLTDAGSSVTSVSAHPGYSDTNLQSSGPTGLLKPFYKVTNALMAQGAEQGAYSEVLAAAGAEAKPGAYYGPAGLGETRGAVGDAQVSDAAQVEADARRLWDLSEELLDYKWEFST